MSIDNTHDAAEPSPASAGSHSVPIDVEELICELHHIAGSERIDADVRRVASKAESAIESLRAWVNELQMNRAEREAIAAAAVIVNEHDEEMDGFSSGVGQTLRRILERLK